MDRFVLNQKVAVEFMKEQQRKANEWAKKHANADQPENSFWRVEIYSENPSAVKISWKEFIGDKVLNSLAHGLYSAFMDPPYGIRIGLEEAESLFERFIQFLMPSFSHPTEIYSWGTTDWANYFDAGKEWWGAYLWTILTEYGESITSIGASSTD